jgi:hypothetical protein
LPSTAVVAEGFSKFAYSRFLCTSRLQEALWLLVLEVMLLGWWGHPHHKTKKKCFEGSSPHDQPSGHNGRPWFFFKN